MDGPKHSEKRTFTCAGGRGRLDVWLCREMPDLSRARIQGLLRAGHILVNGKPAKPHHPVSDADRIEVTIPPPEPAALAAEDIPLQVLFEDGDILVLNKPPGLVVHPAPGHSSGTLVNALLHHCRDPATGETSLAGINGERRPGIVHRLDRDTSGVLVVAKNDVALNQLARQFKDRSIRKEYIAVVWSQPIPESGTIETLVGRNPRDRKKMSARVTAGRNAVTHYRVERTYPEASLVRLRIETGRTHQIRVHMAHIGHPVVGDLQYGRARKTRSPLPVTRQMLHAEKLVLHHPRTDEVLEFVAPMPDDMRALLKALAD